MATQRRTTARTSSSGLSLNKFSFWIIIVIGMAMLVTGCLNWFDWEWVNAFAGWVQGICFALGMFVPVILSYRYARNRTTAWFIVWVIMVVMVVFGLVSHLIGLLLW